MDENISENVQAQNIKIQLEALKDLQLLDDEINLRSSQVEKLQVQVAAEDKALDKLRGAVAERKQELEKLLLDRRQSEATVKQKTDEIQKLSGQLYEVKTNEAYNTLQNEIKQKKQDNGILEERILELMVAEDELRAKLKQSESDLKQGEQEVLGRQNQHKQEIEKVQKEIARIQSQWEPASKQVRSDYLDLYLRLRKAKDGKAVAHIVNDVCTGCRISIRPQAAIELKKYRSLLYCGNCARILYAE